jgi:DNA-binding transcriptional MerR regulator
MRVGELAERAGVNVETLRYYERRGLLPEPARTPNGHRGYDEDALRFVRAVKDAQALGFTLAEIEEYMRVARRGDETASEELRLRTAAKLREVDERLAGLARVRAELARVAGCSCPALSRCTCGAATLARGGEGPARSGTTLHVTNGDSTVHTLERTSLDGRAVPWRDVLHEGPLPLVPRAAYLDERAAFLAAAGWGSHASLAGAFRARDDALLSALGAGRPVVLWFEHDLYDQLQLLDVLALVHAAGVGCETLELVQVGAFPGRPRFRGLGELSPAELETLWPQRAAVTEALLRDAAAAWDDVRSDNPLALERRAVRSAERLPFLAPALARFLEELPGARDGLSRTERQLLRVLDAGRLSPVRVFLATQELEDAPFHGDTWVLRALRELGQGESRLVETAAGSPLLPAPGAAPEGSPFGGDELVLTEAGRRVLHADADRIALLGIDRWVGGTHLLPGAVWRWDTRTRSLLPPD